MDLASVIDEFAANGRLHFTTEQAAEATGASLVATRAALRRLKRKGLVATPVRGFHVFVPPEYRRLGCLPAPQFIPQLMAWLEAPYYLGLLSAAELHGAAHQRPQVTQVIVPANRPSIRCGRVGVQFVARRNAEDIPTVSTNTPRGPVKMSSPEATAFDLVGYSRHSGGLSNVLTVLSELTERLEAERLTQVAPLSPLPWAQRLGYLLELAERPDLTPSLVRYVEQHVHEYGPLRPSAAMRGERNERWKLFVNETLEGDL